jgi:hypothetical protein
MDDCLPVKTSEKNLIDKLANRVTFLVVLASRMFDYAEQKMMRLKDCHPSGSSSSVSIS